MYEAFRPYLLHNLWLFFPGVFVYIILHFSKTRPQGNCSYLLSTKLAGVKPIVLLDCSDAAHGHAVRLRGFMHISFENVKVMLSV
jgi:hypothetical protein